MMTWARTCLLLGREVLRGLRRSPATTTLALIILTAALSAATTTFSVVDTVLLRPLPYPNADRLFAFQRTTDGLNGQSSASPQFHLSLYDAFRQPPAPIAAVGAYQQSWDRLASGQRIESAAVTASIFDVLGIRPLIGSAFTAAHEQKSDAAVVMVGHDLWRREFNSDPNVVGRSLTLTGQPYTILGVMPEGFTFPIDDDRRVEVWTPLVKSWSDDAKAEVTRFSEYGQMVGLLADGATIAHTHDPIVTRAATVPRAAGMRVAAVPFDDALIGPFRTWMQIALAAVAAVLLVGCANVANLLLARGSRRVHELSIRAAIGASRRFLAATVLGEGLVLALVASSVAVLVTWWTLETIRTAMPAGIPRTVDIAVNTRVFIAGGLACLVTVLVAASAPAWHTARADLRDLIARVGTRPNTRRWRAAFTVSQVSLATFLLVLTTLFIGSFVRLVTTDLGFDRHNAWLAERRGIETPGVDIARALAQLPGVESVAALSTGSAPLFGGNVQAYRLWRRHSNDDGEFQPYLYVTPGYFSAAGARIVGGRDFFEDELGRADTVILDEPTAQRLFPDGDAIGKTVSYYLGQPATVVGITTNIREKGPEATGTPRFYLPMSRSEAATSWMIRTRSVDPAIVAAAGALLDGQAAATARTRATVRPLEEAFRTITKPRRFVAGVFSSFGVLALVIGLSGIYGVLWSTVAERTREFGIRAALGATRQRIGMLVVRETVAFVAIGLVVGLAGGYAAGTAVAAHLFEVTPTSPIWYVLVAVIVLVGGLLAALLPARRAASVDPQLVLRAE